MKQNKIVISIHRRTSIVFAFYINPKNTPKWLPFIIREETNEWPVRIGTIYRNQNREGKWTEYIVTDLNENKCFELSSVDGNYHVRYTHIPIDEQKSQLEYFEWVDTGEIEEPFTELLLNNLKEQVENL